MTLAMRSAPSGGWRHSSASGGRSSRVAMGQTRAVRSHRPSASAIVGLEKVAAQPKSGPWREIHAVADRMVPKLRNAFLTAVAWAARKAGTLAAIEAAIRRGSVMETVHALNLEEIKGDLEMRLRQGEFTAALATTYQQAGVAVMPSIVTQLRRQRTVPFGIRFDMQHPRAVEFLHAYDANLVVEVGKELRRGMLDVVQRAFEEGGHPYQQARQIRQLENFGLTKRQLRAVANYRASLLDGGMTGDKLERTTERYRKKLLRYRSENIARTETIRASEAGHQEAWRQAADAGLFDATDGRRFWVITPDDRLCDKCRAIPGLNGEGVGLDQDFRTPEGGVPRPPLHPHCRCSVVMRFPRDL